MFDAEWYNRWRNRGYLNTTTLSSLNKMPFVEDRWHLLAQQLGKYRKQNFAKESK